MQLKQAVAGTAVVNTRGLAMQHRQQPLLTCRRDTQQFADAGNTTVRTYNHERFQSMHGF